MSYTEELEKLGKERAAFKARTKASGKITEADLLEDTELARQNSLLLSGAKELQSNHDKAVQWSYARATQDNDKAAQTAASNHQGRQGSYAQGQAQKAGPFSAIGLALFAGGDSAIHFVRKSYHRLKQRHIEWQHGKPYSMPVRSKHLSLERQLTRDKRRNVGTIPPIEDLKL